MPTKKHFEAIASVLSDFADESTSSYERERTVALVDGLMDEFAMMNPRFDRKRFKAAVFGDQS